MFLWCSPSCTSPPSVVGSKFKAPPSQTDSTDLPGCSGLASSTVWGFDIDSLLEATTAMFKPSTGTHTPKRTRSGSIDDDEAEADKFIVPKPKKSLTEEKFVVIPPCPLPAKIWGAYKQYMNTVSGVSSI